MAKSSFIDTFEMCLNAVLMESKESNNVFFNEKHCTADESRDMNFDKVENRLAYVYKFGCFNIQFVKKCIESFLDNYPEADNIFARENLTICSLSNGPGLDIIGLLGAIYESSKRLKCSPVLNIINLYTSWFTICSRMLTSIYKVNDTFGICIKDVRIMQSDIYSTILPEAKDCIRATDILLMVKVFASTKATSNVVIKSMEEIFSLLKPGSFVFFVGSKKNTKELTADDSLSRFVNCILGPTKISVENVPVNKDVIKIMNVKPKQSGYAYFIVWQKKDTVSLEVIPPKKKRNRRKKKKSKVNEVQKELTNGTPASSELTDDIDSCSEVSFSSWSKQSETSDEFKTTTCENVLKPASPVEISREILNLVLEDQNLSQNDLLHSINSITSLLDKFHMQPINASEENVKEMGENNLESRKDSICDLESNIQDKEFKNHVGKDEITTEKKNQDDSINEVSVKQSVDTEEVLNEDSQDAESHLVKCILPAEDNDTHLLGKSNMGHSCNEERHILAVQPNTNLEKNMQEKKVEIPLEAKANTMCTGSKVKQVKKGELVTNNFSKLKESPNLKVSTCGEVSMSDTSSVKNSVNKIYPANMLLPVMQNGSSKKVGDNEIMKVPKKNRKQSMVNKKTVSLPELNIENKKNGPKIISGNQLHENLAEFKRNTTVKEEKVSDVSDKNKQNLNSLLQRCESLVTSLETLTANFRRDLALSNDQDSRCCIRESCAKFRNPHAGICSCCINAVHSNCYRKVYNCQVCKNSTCTTCSKTLPCRTSQ